MIFILPNILCQAQSASTCSMGETAKNETDCLKKSVNGTFCCFLKPLEDSSKESICYPYKVTEFSGGLHINHNSITYEINCGLGSTFMDSFWNLTVEDRYICGVENPNGEKDCFAGSTTSNSCCYYEGYGLKSCYWLGKKYQAKVTRKGYTFSCSSQYNKISKILMLILSLGLIL